mgnify:CR=1 FL=1
MDGGSLLVDGLAEGVLVDAPFDADFLRTASFGLLQGSRMRNVKTEFVSRVAASSSAGSVATLTIPVSNGLLRRRE